MLINECKPEFQFKKSSKNAKFGQCLYLLAHLCCNPSLSNPQFVYFFIFSPNFHTQFRSINACTFKTDAISRLHFASQGLMCDQIEKDLAKDLATDR